MPRKLRIQFPGAIYHIVTRGDGRRELFHDDDHYAKFTDGLRDEVERSAWQVLAFCWMPNHIHLLLTTPEPNLSSAMYSQYVGSRCSAPGPEMAALLCRRFTSSTRAELSAAFGLGHPDSAANLLRRAKEKQNQSPAYRRKLRDEQVVLKPENRDCPPHPYRWKYDNLGRLVEEIFDDGDDGSSASDYVDRFAFDLAGNRVWKDTDLGNSNPDNFSADEKIDYVYDANDRLVTEVFDGAEEDTNAVYEYGSGGTTAYGGDHTVQTAKTVRKGRVIGQGPTVETQTLEYNNQGRLSKATTTKGGQTPVTTESEYEYNEDGFRVSQTTDGSTTRYLVDPNNDTGYAQTLEERTASGEVVKTYTIGLDVVTQATAAAVYHLLYDLHGSTRGVFDGNSTAMPQLYAYDAYGERLDLTGFAGALEAALVSLLYSGEHRDSATGWDYNRARWRQDGRFNRLDPFAGDYFSPLSLNKYGYAHNDSINGIDPTGHSLTLVGLAGAGAAVVGAYFLLSFLNKVATWYLEVGLALSRSDLSPRSLCHVTLPSC